MPATTAVERNRAIARGLEFIYRTACETQNFDCYGFDYLSCFCGIALTAPAGPRRTRAQARGAELARRWRAKNSTLARDADADDVVHFLSADDAAARLGLPDARLKSQIQKAAAGFKARDYFWFDPLVEGPPRDVPEACDCGCDNDRGRKICSSCNQALTMMSPYEVWVVALIRSYMGERHGTKLGAAYSDVIKWLPSMRPYPSVEPLDWNSVQAVYAVTHLIYTLNDYNSRRLLPPWL